MSDKPKAPPIDSANDDEFNDPDLQNSEQNEEGTQAQDVAEDAIVLTGEDEDPLESEDGSPSGVGDIVPRDVPDLVENLKNMLNSGRIDMDAFEGEEGMDDNDEDE